MKKTINKPNRIYINSLTLGNFKAFGPETKIEMSPMVNLIFGKNSTGKSSVLQGLRLFRQSYNLNQLTPFNFESPQQYKDNGGIDFDIPFKGIINDGDENKNLTLGVETNIISNQNEITNQQKEVKFSFFYKKKLYKGNNLVEDRVLLKNLIVKNDPNSVRFNIEFTKAKKFQEGKSVDKKLQDSESFIPGSRDIGGRSDKIYKSLYSPYYYELKVKSIEIDNLESIFTTVPDLSILLSPRNTFPDIIKDCAFVLLETKPFLTRCKSALSVFLTIS